MPNTLNNSTPSKGQLNPGSPDPKPRSLHQQNADFTSEGSPPPGKVAKEPPATLDKDHKKKPATSSTPTKHKK